MKVSRFMNGCVAGLSTFIILFFITACSGGENNGKTALEEEEVEVISDQNNEAEETRLTDAQIASVVVVANQIDVNYGKIALQNATNDEARKFAQTMIDDHKGIIQTAVALAERLGVTPDDDNDITRSLLEGETEMSVKLSALKGKEFNKAYIENEVNYHEAVISAVKDVLIPQTDNEELKNTLIEVTPLLEHHLKMAQEAKDKIGA